MLLRSLARCSSSFFVKPPTSYSSADQHYLSKLPHISHPKGRSSNNSTCDGGGGGGDPTTTAAAAFSNAVSHSPLTLRRRACPLAVDSTLLSRKETEEIAERYDAWYQRMAAATKPEGEGGDSGKAAVDEAALVAELDAADLDGAMEDALSWNAAFKRNTLRH